jgi:hypothetical protein
MAAAFIAERKWIYRIGLRDAGLHRKSVNDQTNTIGVAIPFAPVNA